MQLDVLNDLAKAKRRWTEKKATPLASWKTKKTGWQSKFFILAF